MPAAAAETTGMAILGLIAGAPASAHELSQRMALNYGYFWRRARSHVYAEVKHLAASGWVSATDAATGNRPRTEYAITAAGRRALARWLASTPDVFALEMDALVRLYLAPHGRAADLGRTLEFMQLQAEGMIELGQEITAAYLAGRPPPPHDELYQRAPLLDFLAGFGLFVQQWAQRSRKLVAMWDGEPARRDKAARAALEALAVSLAQARGAPVAKAPGPARAPKPAGTARRVQRR